MAIFLIATLGFTIYSHHCNSSGQTYTSFFEKNLEEKDPCHHESKVEKTCCSMTTNCESERMENRCCSNYKVFVRANILQNLPSNSWEIVINDITLFECDFDLLATDTEKTKPTAINNTAIPPPVSGAELIIMLHHQKISPGHII